ncbi:hypothetical protein [Thiomicrorhabdus xiamenensis]|uniref:Uncharacterized protein n=1 Tax=Thiomicrorhabdus xiamenensis TaxID=2739063 RepID=A0A7D4NMN5_9GAMM|nr:hypothetical protein [Thiomicrorhabdus xiamenensis]QKI90194.1 hypothetical protein HQN79_11715 [Thiomicrorhabdus xiamenensis]
MTSKPFLWTIIQILLPIALWLTGAAYYFLASVGLGMAFSLETLEYDADFFKIVAIGLVSLCAMGIASYFSRDRLSQLISFALIATFIFYGVYNAIGLIEDQNSTLSIWLLSVGSLFIPPLLWILWPFKHLRKRYFENIRLASHKQPEQE